MNQSEILAQRINNFFHNLDVLIKWALVGFAVFVVFVGIFAASNGLNEVFGDGRTGSDANYREYIRYQCDPQWSSHPAFCATGDYNSDGVTDSRDDRFNPYISH